MFKGAAMPNGYFNNQVREGLNKSGKGKELPSGKKPATTIGLKPGFKTGAPGKTQKDRSGGVKKAKIYPDSDGL
jgi:hypothetical protein